MAADSIVELNQANWKTEVLDAAGPVLVDFWAEWCGPCRALGPVLDALAGEMAGKLKIGKVNVDENYELANQFSIRSIPCMLLFKQGKVAQQMVGAMTKPALKAKLDPELG